MRYEPGAQKMYISCAIAFRLQAHNNNSQQGFRAARHRTWRSWYRPSQSVRMSSCTCAHPRLQLVHKANLLN